MNGTELLRNVARSKHISVARLAEMMGKPYTTLRNNLYKENIRSDIFMSIADALGCDVVLVDRQTGEIYR